MPEVNQTNSPQLPDSTPTPPVINPNQNPMKEAIKTPSPMKIGAAVGGVALSIPMFTVGALATLPLLLITAMDKGLTHLSQISAESNLKTLSAILGAVTIVPKTILAVVGYPTYFASCACGRLLDYAAGVTKQTHAETYEEIVSTPFRVIFGGTAKRIEMWGMTADLWTQGVPKEKIQERANKLAEDLVSALKRYGDFPGNGMRFNPYDVETILYGLDGMRDFSKKNGDDTGVITQVINEAKAIFRKEVFKLITEERAFQNYNKELQERFPDKFRGEFPAIVYYHVVQKTPEEMLTFIKDSRHKDVQARNILKSLSNMIELATNADEWRQKRLSLCEKVYNEEIEI